MDKIDSVIKIIPIVDSLNGTMIIGETGDKSHVEKHCLMLSYAGLNPTIYQSSDFNAAKTRCRNAVTNYFAMHLSTQPDKQHDKQNL